MDILIAFIISVLIIFVSALIVFFIYWLFEVKPKKRGLVINQSNNVTRGGDIVAGNKTSVVSNVRRRANRKTSEDTPLFWQTTFVNYQNSEETAKEYSVDTKDDDKHRYHGNNGSFSGSGASGSWESGGSSSSSYDSGSSYSSSGDSSSSSSGGSSSYD